MCYSYLSEVENPKRCFNLALSTWNCLRNVDGIIVCLAFQSDSLSWKKEAVCNKKEKKNSKYILQQTKAGLLGMGIFEQGLKGAVLCSLMVFQGNLGMR